MYRAAAAGIIRRTETQRLRALLENGVGRSFDLRSWCERDSCALGTSDRLALLLEQCRPEVAKLIVMEHLEAEGQEDAEELTYGEVTNSAFLQLLRRHAAAEPIVGNKRVHLLRMIIILVHLHIYTISTCNYRV